MYQYQINEQIEALVKARIITKADAKKAGKVLQEYWTDRIAVTWAIEDVIEQAKQNGRRISKEKARDILATLLHKHDAGVGINWEVINCYLN